MVNHDRLIARLKSRCSNADLLRLVNRFLKAGVSVEGRVVSAHLGVPQGALLSPVLASVVLNELDWEPDWRGHRFVRYADDCNIRVKSKCAGMRVMANVTRYVSDTLRLIKTAQRSLIWGKQCLPARQLRGGFRRAFGGCPGGAFGFCQRLIRS